jgi:transposase-like protein
MARELDALVATFRTRPLDAGPYAYLWIDAQTQRCREGGRVVNVTTVTAIGVNTEGYRRSWAAMSSPPRTAPAGPPSCATSSRVA